MATSKFKAGLAVVVVLSAVTTMFLQHRTREQLRNENDSLREQLGQLSSHQDAVPEDNSTLQTSSEMNELSRLRGEATALRAQTDLLAELREQNRQLQQALLIAAHKQTPAEDPNAEKSRAYVLEQYDTARLAAKGMQSYATDHDNNFPTTFDQAASYYASNHLKTNLNDFEIVYQDPLTNIANPSSVIVVRSVRSWINTNGRMAKVYGFADGHAEMHEALVSEYFDRWEQKHVPILKNQ
jgi:cell division protein FtsL